MAKNKRIKWLVLSLVATLILAASGAYLARNSFLAWAFTKAQNKLSDKYAISLEAKKVMLEGINKLNIQNLYCTYQRTDTLLNVNQLTAEINLWHLLFGELVLNSIQGNNIHIAADINKLPVVKNNDDNKTTNSPKTLTQKVHTIVDKLLAAIQGSPLSVQLVDFKVRINDSLQVVRFNLDSLQLFNGQLTSTGSLGNDTTLVPWKAKGKLNPRVLECNLTIHLNHTTPWMPFDFLTKVNTKANLRSVLLQLNEVTHQQGQWNVKGYFSAFGAAVFNPKIADKVVRFSRLGGNFITHFAENRIEVDSASEFYFNQIPIKTYAFLDQKGQTLVGGKLISTPVATNTFFGALPEGMFQKIYGYKGTGTLQFYGEVYTNITTKDTLAFDCGLVPNNFSITHWGNTNLTQLNGSYNYQPFQSYRVLRMGLDNPAYIPYAYINPVLVKCVLAAEDNRFWSHKGFYPGAFTSAMLTNMRRGRFAKGGSSISQQLIKNVFLTRAKYISRKVEEAIMVWIIEQNRLVSKQKMLENYLNLIEWGPEVYGIGEASQFYFNKHPMDLTPEECIFLAMIIPNPKGYKWNFTPEGTLKPNRAYVFRNMGKLLEKSGIAVFQPVDSLYTQLKLTGRALNVFTQPDEMGGMEQIQSEELEIQF